MLGAAFFLMHIDFANGGHEAWPVYLFAGVAFACAIVWSCLAAFGWRAGPRKLLIFFKPTQLPLTGVIAH
jgi:hypothetical protein